MPLTLKDLTSKTKPLAIKVDEDPAAFNIVYRPHNMTADVETRVAAAAEKGLEIKGLIAMVLNVVESWDLQMEAKGPIVELSEKGLQDFPGDILLLVMEQITEDIKPDPKT